MRRRHNLTGVLTGSNRGRLARIIRAVILLTAFPGTPEPATPQADGEPISLGHYRVVHSSILQEDRLLQVHLPRGYESGDLAYPVLYLFYAEMLEGYFSQVVNDLYHLTMDRAPPMILVGIPNTQRYRDLLPWPSGDGQGGQAARFLAFVREELLPFVEKEYRTKPFRILVGPQAAAVFGVYALLEAPETFHAFVLNDPCRIDSDERSVCDELLAFARTPEGRGRYLSVTYDLRDDRWGSGRVEALRKGLDAGALDGFRWRIAGVDDWPFFLAPVQLRDALLDLFSDYPLPNLAEVRSLTEVEAHYAELGRAFGFSFDPPNLVLSRVSDHLVEQGAYEEARIVLDRLVEIHPSSLDGPWRLANLYRITGDTATAILYYQECLRRDPNIGPAREWLDRLRGGG